MSWIGDFPEAFTSVPVFFTTHDGNGAPVAPLTAFEADDVKIYKNGDAAQKTSTNGLTMTSPFDSITGLHRLLIDTSNNTGDAAFWVTNATYTVVLNPDTETVNSQTALKVLATFGIGLGLHATTNGRTLDVATTGEAGLDFDNIKDATGAHTLTNITVPTVTTVAAVTTVNGLAANVITTASIANDAITDAKVASDVTIASVTGAVGSVTGSVGSVVGLTAANLDATISSRASAANLATVAGYIDTEISDIQARLPAALVGGRMDASVGAMAANVLTATAIATDAITAAKIAADAIGASELAADAVTEIQSGLATSAALATVQSDTDNIQTRLPAALVGGRMDSNVSALAGNVQAADYLFIESQAFATGVCDTGSSTTSLNISSLDASMAVNNQLAGRYIVFRADTTTSALQKQARRIVSSFTSLTGMLTVDALTTAPVSGDAFIVVGGASAASDAAILAAIAALNNLSAAQVNAEVDTALADYDGPTHAELTAELASADDAVLAQVALVKAKTDNLPSDPADQSLIIAATDALATLIGDVPTNAELATSQAAADDATLAAIAALDGKIDTIDNFLDTEVAAILADTNELQTDWADGGRLDLILDARASQSSVDDLPTNAELATALGTADDAVLTAIDALPTNAELATALGTADDAVLAAIAALNNLSAAQVNSEVDTALADINLDHLVKIAVDTDFATTVHLNSVVGNLADNGTSATFDRTTDALEAIRDRGDAAWTTGTALDAAGVRAAVGLATANLDTQLDALPTNAELATALGTADDAVLTAIDALPTNTELATALGTADDAVLSALSTLQTSVDDLPTNAELATALGTADDAVLTAIDALPTNAELATALGTADDAVLAQVALVKAVTDKISPTASAIGRGTVTTGASTTSVPTSAFLPAGAVADQFKGRVILFDATTTTTTLRGTASTITASSNASTPTFTVDTLPATPQSGDTFSIV